MTDFLTRVSRAALGLTPVVQVLGASRYAPGPDLYMGEMMIAEEREVDVVGAEATARVERASPDPERTTRARKPYGSDPLPHAPYESDPPAHAPLPAVRQSEHDAKPAFPVADPAQETQVVSHADALPVAQGRPISHVDAGSPRAEVPLRRTVAPHAPDQPPLLPTDTANTSLIPSHYESGHDAAAFHEPLRLAIDPEPAAPAERARAMLNAPRTRSEVTAIEIMDALEPAPGVRDTATIPAVASSEVAIADRERRPQTMPLFDVAERGISSVSHRAERLPLHERPGAEPSSPPVIRVTIGRIDVRAVTPPPPPVEAPGPPAPRLSLDEYLQSHNGRSR